MQCLVQGFTSREIEDRLGLSQLTVKNRLFRIFEQLGVSSRLELVVVASPEFANTPCPFCTRPFGEHMNDELCECVRKGSEKRGLH